jgi:hypothetical protein
MLEDVARQRINELRSYGHQLVRAIDQLLNRPQKRRNNSRAKKSAMNRRRQKRGYGYRKD